MIFGQSTDYNLQLFADHDLAVMVTEGSQITASISHQQQWLPGSGKLTFPIIGVKTRFFLSDVFVFCRVMFRQWPSPNGYQTIELLHV